MKRTKKFVVALLAMAMAFSVFSASASALSYSFSFEGDFYNCMEYTDLVSAQRAPFVSPYHSSALTVYYLAPASALSEWATEPTKISTSGYHSLEYYSGYGGGTQKYRLCGYPDDHYFDPYDISGTWGT